VKFLKFDSHFGGVLVHFMCNYWLLCVFSGKEVKTQGSNCRWSGVYRENVPPSGARRKDLENAWHPLADTPTFSTTIETNRSENVDVA